MRLALLRNTEVPIYRQIVNQVRNQIRAGLLPVGSRLPPVRELAAEHGLTRLTVHSAYAELQAQGLVESHVGRGTFVAADALQREGSERHTQPPREWISQGVLADLLRVDGGRDALSFAQAFPAPETYPLRELGRALQGALKDPSALGYGPIQGEAELREQIATLLLDRGLSVSAEHVLVTAGAQQGIDLVLRALTGPGDVMLVEEPTYPGVLDLAALRGQRVIGVPGDAGGIRVDALDAACAAHRPRLLYLIPTHGNPTGRTLAPERRAAILRLAHAHGMLVVEDDIYGFLGFDRPAPPPLKCDDAEDQVVYITAFSKALAPALRLGALVAPASLLPSLASLKGSSDLVCSTLLQRALADYLRQGHLTAHLRQVRALYRERRDAMLEALQHHLSSCAWTYPEGGLSLWVSLSEGVVERDFTAEALQQGVGVAPGRLFFPQAQQRAFMRLSFGVHAPERIDAGVATLGRVLDTHLRQRSPMLSLAGGAVGPLV